MEPPPVELQDAGRRVAATTSRSPRSRTGTATTSTASTRRGPASTRDKDRRQLTRFRCFEAGQRAHRARSSAGRRSGQKGLSPLAAQAYCRRNDCALVRLAGTRWPLCCAPGCIHHLGGAKKPDEVAGTRRPADCAHASRSVSCHAPDVAHLRLPLVLVRRSRGDLGRQSERHLERSGTPLVGTPTTRRSPTKGDVICQSVRSADATGSWRSVRITTVWT